MAVVYKIDHIKHILERVIPHDHITYQSMLSFHSCFSSFLSKATKK